MHVAITGTKGKTGKGEDYILYCSWQTRLLYTYNKQVKWDLSSIPASQQAGKKRNR